MSFYKDFRISVRRKLVNFILSILDRINLPNKVKAFLIRSCHFQTPVNFLILVLVLEFKFAVICIVPLIIAFILFIFFEGCFITNIEYKLDKENHLNIIDPYLYFFNIKINDNNRFNYSIIIALFYFLLVGIILFIKYII